MAEALQEQEVCKKDLYKHNKCVYVLRVCVCISMSLKDNLNEISNLHNSFVYYFLGASITHNSGCILGKHHLRSMAQDLFASFVQGKPNLLSNYSTCMQMVEISQ